MANQTVDYLSILSTETVLDKEIELLKKEIELLKLEIKKLKEQQYPIPYYPWYPPITPSVPSPYEPTWRYEWTDCPNIGTTPITIY